MKITTKAVAIVVSSIGALAFFNSCAEEKGPAEKAGEKVDNAVEKAGDKIEDATDN